MSLLAQLFGGSSQPAGRSLENPSVSLLDADAWAEAFGTRYTTEAAEPVTAGRAISLSAFWSAVGQIAGTCSRIPISAKVLDGGQWITDEAYYLLDLIGPCGSPGQDLSAVKFWRRVYTHALIYGNGYVWLDWSNDGRVASLVQLLSDRTGVARHGGRQWVVTEVGDGGRLVARPYDEVLHLEGLCLDGLAGCDTVAQAREDLGNALASRKFKSKFFGQGMHAGGVLQAPPGAKPDAVRKVEEAIQEQHATTNRAFRTLVLRDGFKWFSTQVNPQQAEMTSSDETAVRDVARRFMLSPARLGVRESISYNSLEMERRDYHDTTLAFWLSMLEGELNTKAVPRAERGRRKLVYGMNLALVFADASTLSAIGNGGLQNGWLHRDEVRAWFGLAPRDDLASEPPPASTTPDPAAARSAHRGVVQAELERLVRRYNVHAERVARRSDSASWEQLPAELLERHQAVAVAALEPIVAACRTVGLLGEHRAEDIAAALHAAYVERMGDRAAWPPDLTDLAAEVAARFC